MASVFEEIEACHQDTLHYKGGAPEPLTLNTEQHFFLHILLDRNMEGAWDLYILKTVINRQLGYACMN